MCAEIPEAELSWDANLISDRPDPPFEEILGAKWDTASLIPEMPLGGEH